ncbi:MAG: HAMP domain-containing protein [Burkholderiales bacterium]|nr:HAMP domain-containing protein [Burkholderiales bacterium]
MFTFPKARLRPGRRWIDRALRPGRQLMLRLRMSGKVALMAASVLLPMCALMAMVFNDEFATRRATLVEIQGAEVSELIMPLVLRTQLLRGLANRVLDGDTQAGAARDEARHQLAAAVAALDAHLAAGRGDYALADAWKPVRAQLLALPAGRNLGDAAAVFARHSEAVEALRQFALLNGERSTMVLDPEPRAYFLVDVIVNALIPVVETTAQARGLGAGLIARGGVTPDERADLLGLAGAMQRGVSDIAGKLASLERAGGEVPGSWAQARALTLGLAHDTRAIFGGGTVAADGGDYFEHAGTAVGLLGALQHDATLRLRAELDARVRRIDSNMALQGGSFALGLALLAYLLTCFSVTFRQSLAGLMRGTEAIAAGNLAHRLDIEGRDELADIGHVVEAMSDRLSALVSEIRNSASMVNQTGQQVSDGSARLANRTDEQASSLRGSVSAIGELSTAVAANAEAARSLDQLTERLARQASESNTAMQDTVQAMLQMQQASERVAEVVAVIDDVAFQTGMLSLNAAIEAARAGDAGKGFAVVATEVRQLAKRCGDSADEIRHLIGDAGLQVQISSEKLGHVSEALAVIVDGVQEVSVQLRTISASSTQQSAGLDEVTQTVGNLDEITRENAALVEESSTASHALVDRAAKLREAVATMRLRQGSADEALAMIERARAHLDRVGRSQAFADFHDRDGEFIDRDLYIFSGDRSGTILAHGAHPGKVGESFQSQPGLNGHFLEQVWAAADAGGGWVKYEIGNPLTGEITPKESYVTCAADGTLLGCGIYRHDAIGSTPAGKPRAQAWSVRDEDVATLVS